MNTNSNFRINFTNKPLFRFIPRLSILPDLLLNDLEKKNLFDPIGNQPFLLADLADSGARIISAPVNPIDKLILDCMFDPPSQEFGSNLLSKFFNFHIGEQRLDQHIRSLYHSSCAICGRLVEVNFYIRNGPTGELVGKSFNCGCGFSGIQDATDQDQDLDAQWRRSDGLYRSRITRLFTGAREISERDVMDAMLVYSPRSLYSLDLILQKITSTIPLQEQKYYQLALVFIADSVSGLWNISNNSELPKLIYQPKRMIEFNVWTAIQESANLLREIAKFKNRSALSSIPETSFTAGISVVKKTDLKIEQLNKNTSLVAVIPRPNQAYWSLSALWSRWFLDLPTDEAFLRSISRKKIDWDWFYEASTALLHRLSNFASDSVPLNFILTEKEPDYVSSFMFAMNNENYRLEDYSILNQSNTLVLKCRLGHPTIVFTGETVRRSKPDYIKQLVREYLIHKAIPVPYEILVMELMCQLSMDKDFVFQRKQHKIFLKNLNEILTSGDFEDIESRNTPETGTWKIRSTGIQQPLL